MDIQSNGQGNSGSRRRYGKFVLGFFGMLAGIFVLYVAGFWGIRWYEQWQGQKRVQAIAEGMKRATEEALARAMADTYGGKTPQETLQMYIEAVEKGDYELASKYFIEEKRDEELRKVKNSSESQIGNYLKKLELAMGTQGSFSADKKGYVVTSPLLVDFKLYPSGIWKLIEI